MRALTPFDQKVMAQYGPNVAGVDEVGYSALAGPLCACALVLRRPDVTDTLPDGQVIDDSKGLRFEEREALLPWIRRSSWSAVAWVTNQDIDRLKNIQEAAKLAMRRAVTKLLRTHPISAVIVDHYAVDLPIPALAEDKADARSFIVASASIVAKVYRDRFMKTQHHRWPVYGFDTNVGYRGRGQHLDALRKHGPCPLHRRHMIDRNRHKLS